MQLKHSIGFYAASIAIMATCCGKLEAQQPAIAKPFNLKDLNGREMLLNITPKDKLTVICFFGIECPLAKLYAGRLQRLADQFSDKGVRFIGINSNRQDSPSELADFANDQQINFPLGKDYDNVIADRFQVQRTPEVIVVDSNRKIRYRGRIDDQYLPGVSRSKPERHDLTVAIKELLAGNAVSVPVTKPEGCLLGRVTKPVTDATVTFCDQILRVLQKHCVECHHADDIGPFSLTDYDEVVGWGDMMVEVIDNGRMPPWHADSTIGHFKNGRKMPESDKQLIRDWVKLGMPYGRTEQLPAPRKFASGWQLPREPDLIIAMQDRPFTIPADGTVEYQYFVVDPNFKKDVWVVNAEVIPGNRAVVHHSIVFIRPPDGTRMTGIGWLGAYVPGQRLPETRPNLARRIPAGSRLVFQQHYTPNGKPQTDVTRIGLVFADEKDVTHERLTLTAMNQGFELTPKKADQKVVANVHQLPKQGQLLGIAPHMHYRGDQFLAKAVSKNGKSVLLRVPQYDFNWQHNYELANPLDISSLEGIETEFVFDNSDANPFNPDPSRYVTWGDQTWEEMAVAFFDVALPRKTEPDDQKVSSKESANQTVNEEIRVKAKQRTEDFMKRFDANRDDLIQADELPLTIRVKEFRRCDVDRNGQIDRDELMDRFRARLQ